MEQLAEEAADTIWPTANVILPRLSQSQSTARKEATNEGL